MSTFQYQYNDLQRKWLDDLKTTQAKQTKEFLHIRNKLTGFEGFCCLGRACVVAGLPECGIHYDAVDYGQDGEEHPPEDLTDSLKLLSRGGKLRTYILARPDKEHGEVWTHLTSLNDHAEWTFKQIAEYIEANPDNVFSDYDEQKEAYEESLQRLP